MTIERSLNELYLDPERADALAFGRRTGPSRRGFLEGAGLAALGAVLGGAIPFAANMPGGLLSAALAQNAPPPRGPQLLHFPGKDGRLVVLGERPLVAETPEALLDDDTTPTDKFFIRNNGQIPATASAPDEWKIIIDGEVERRLDLSLGELKQKFRPVTQRMVLECAGNGRAFFSPPVRGHQWTNGGVGCARWTGVRLSDVLRAAGVTPAAKFTGHLGADPNLLGEPNSQALSRGVPINKAMDPNTLIVWAMNGEALPLIHGFPVRLIVPGWPGSLSEKWLARVWVRDRPHDGPGTGGTAYRVPIKPMVPGAKADDGNFRDLESMPVRAIVTNPASGAVLPAGTRELKLRGAAWDGDSAIKTVQVSIDYGGRWIAAQLGKPQNRYDWTRWTASVKLPADGNYEIWARATDTRGTTQMLVAANWNPGGYGANPVHRVAVRVG
jgi:DMSO/TMAO reductase YedYZ molybdopterin-dependent catalytic subunit